MALVADRYRGTVAETYEAKRRDRPPWADEQRLVAALVRSGPVLDVPIGTGRYLEIYRDKGLAVMGCDISPDMIAQARKRQPDLQASIGSIFALPFEPLQFATAVCTRLLNWFRPPEMILALSELRRVASEIVLSLRVGDEREWSAYTHSEATMRLAIDGLLIDRRETIRDEGKEGIYTMFRLRRATWSDVLDQFSVSGGEKTVYRLADEWADRYAEPHRDYRRLPVRAEWWSRARLDAAITDMAAVEPRIVTDHRPSGNVVAMPPRQDGRPLTMLQFGSRYGMIDGRRRVNKWIRCEGVYPVLVIPCSSC